MIETIVPTKIGTMYDMWKTVSGVVWISYNVAPNIAGIANKNENLADSLLLRPNNIPVEIVEPDLDIPGMIARACEIPIVSDFKVLFLFNSVFFLCVGYCDLNFVENKITPVINNAIDTMNMSEKSFTNMSWRKYPAKAVGIEAMIM